MRLKVGAATSIGRVRPINEDAYLAHVGDSRAYLCDDTGLAALTTDHSLVEAQVQAGLIDREQSLKSEQQNILLRALGRDPDVQVELSESVVGDGDRLLLCSDGLTRVVSDDRLAAALQRFAGAPQACCDYLVDAANDAGGPDNITVVVVEVQGTGWRDVVRRVLRF